MRASFAARVSVGLTLGFQSAGLSQCCFQSAVFTGRLAVQTQNPLHRAGGVNLLAWSRCRSRSTRHYNVSLLFLRLWSGLEGFFDRSLATDDWQMQFGLA